MTPHLAVSTKRRCNIGYTHFTKVAATAIAVGAAGSEVDVISSTGQLTPVGIVNTAVAVTDAATYSITAANTGKLHIVPDLAASCTISLPTASAGLNYKLIYGGVAADAQDWVIDTGSDTNFFLGGLVHLDTDAGAGGDEIVPIAGDGNSNSKLTVVTPDVGTEVNLYCDGTNWYLSGFAVSATVPAFADQ